MSKLALRGSSVVLLIIGSLLARRAAADEAEARQLYNQGETAYIAGRFDDAARLFQRGYQAYPHPLLLWNMATAYRKQYTISQNPAELRRARVVYQHYIEMVDSEPQRAEARDAIADLDAELARQPSLAAPVSSAASAPAAAPERPRRRIWPWLVGGAGLLVAGAVVLTVVLVVPDNAPVRASSDGAMRVSFP
jgi:hypothetical protein